MFALWIVCVMVFGFLSIIAVIKMAAWFFAVLGSAPGPQTTVGGLSSAGRIHDWEARAYLHSDSHSPFAHPKIDWSSGKYGVVMLDEALAHPHYFPAVVGTIAILNPQDQRGQVAVVYDNHKAVQLGYDPVPPAALSMIGNRFLRTHS